MLNGYAPTIAPHAIFGNRKTNDRFVSTLETLGKKFGQSIPRSSNNKREMESIYHFFNSNRVRPEYIIWSERDRLIEFISNERPCTWLSIGDVTTLNYTKQRSASKMGFVTSKNQPAYNVLSQLFCDEQGVPIGLFDQIYWNYKVEELGKRRQRQHLSIEFKETAHYLRQWKSLNDTFANHPQSRFIHLFDRAGDVHELLQTQEHSHIFYIIRSKNDRKLLDENVSVSEMLDGLQPSGEYELQIHKQSPPKQTFIQIKRQKGTSTESRKAKIEVTFATATLRASNASKNRPLKPFQVGIVRAKELSPPAGAEAIEWTLFTTLPVNTFEDAMEVIRFYTLRWQIENFHYTLKQGAKVEELQFEEPKAIWWGLQEFFILKQAFQVFSSA